MDTIMNVSNNLLGNISKIFRAMLELENNAEFNPCVFFDYCQDCITKNLQTDACKKRKHN
ncbi:MAG: hypothetical protein LBU68_01475 [Rickettsiales bacterium]|jgi:hypothetical protein|nr:hypothetical protein [Rickettsiales bacterium]